MSYQFIHIEDYGINISKKRSNNGTSEKYKKETKGRSVSQIISEAKRDNGFCSHVEKPEDELTVGQEIQAKVTELDLDNKKISLSIKETLEKPSKSEETENDAE